MGKYKRLLSNTAILGAGTFTSKVLVFLLMPFYTAILSSEQFGTADVLMQTANLLIPLATLGVSDGLFRFALNTDKAGRQRAFSTCLLVFLIGIIPLAALTQLLRAFSIYNGYVWLVLLYVCTANFHSLAANFLRAEGRMRAFAIQGIANTVLTIVLNVLFLAVFRMGVLGYLLSVAVSDFCVTAVLLFACRLTRSVNFRAVEKSYTRELLKFSIPYIPTTMMWMITSASDRFIVTAFAGAAENGLYAAAYKLPTLISLAGGVFIEAWHFSSVNDAAAEERTRFFELVYKNYIGIMFMGTAVLVAGSRLLSMLLLDEAYHSSWIYVPVLGIAMLFSAFSSFMGSVYFVEKRSLRSLVTASLGALLNIGLNFALIPTYGAMGASVATVASYMLVFAIRAIDTKKYLRFRLCLPRLIVNTSVLCAQTVLMLARPVGWIWYQAAALIFMLVFNGHEIFCAILTFAKKFLKK